jgi:hypothetical protein
MWIRFGFEGENGFRRTCRARDVFRPASFFIAQGLNGNPGLRPVGALG